MGTATKVEKVTVKNKNNEKAAPAKTESAKPVDANIFAQRIEKKAYELYEKRGCEGGHDWDDWLEAEKIVEQEMIAGQ